MPRPAEYGAALHRREGVLEWEHAVLAGASQPGARDPWMHLRMLTASALGVTCDADSSSHRNSSQVRESALQTSRVHGRSTTGTPWIFAPSLC